MPTQFIDLGDTDNTLTLGDDDYIIIGANGNNTLTLGNGDDTLTLGNGNNTLTLGGGTNEITAGTGSNTITTNGLGSVKITLSDGNNTVTVDDGPAAILVGNGINTIVAGDGKNAIVAGDGVNTITSGNGDSSIVVGDGDGNMLVVGTGANVIRLGTGTANLLQAGGGGNTLFVAAAPLGTDTIEGALTTLDGTGNQVNVTTTGAVSITGVTGFQTFRLADGGLNSLVVNNGNFIRLPGQSITVVGGDAGNTVTASSLSATNAVVLIGGTKVDLFTGGAGNDTLDGRGGADVMTGGAGNDRYFVDNAQDKVIEAAAGGMDVVLASVNYTLGDGQAVEILRANAGATGLSLRGNELDNRIYGGIGNDILNGKAGADEMAGGDGNDTYIVDQMGDRVIEAAGGGTDTVFALSDYTLRAGQEIEYLRAFTGSPALRLTGNELDNRIYGGTGGDTLNGMAGADVMAGGTGNDRYFVDQAGDTVFEAVGGGTDTVLTTADYTLRAGEEVELLRAITGSPGLRLNGNEFANGIYGAAGDDTINGMAGADVMAGLAGNDRYFVDNAGDRVVETAGGGTDTVFTTVDFALGTGQEVEILRALGGAGGLRLSGNEMNNRIFGGTGDDTINGGGGADMMAGGAGDDRYFVDNAGDTIVELSGMGTDIVFSSTPSFILAADVENLSLLDGATSGTGNDLANIIRAVTGAGTVLGGKGGDDKLIGGDGADTLNGGLGVDVLTGGAGADSFAFLKGAADGDRITDFVVGTDHIDFYGYDIGATFAKVAGAWTVTDGASTEVINFTVFPVTLTAADYHFY